MFSEFAESLRQEIETKLPAFKTLLPKEELQKLAESALARLNLVTREEFDAQAAVLQRTRMMLEELEKRCSQLEAKNKD